MKSIYLDYNATTPVDPEVAKAMEPFLHGLFGNPSSMHRYGTETRLAVEQAREQVARLIGAQPYEIIFTSGGTESNNLAIQGVARALRHRGNHIITTSVEHPAVIEVCRFLEKEGFQVTYVPVDRYGMVDPEQVERAITASTILISVMHANNETGTIQPVAEIGKIARKRGVIMHSDAAQSVGKIPVEVGQLQVDLLSVAGHKLYAPKGIGALYIRQGVQLEKIIHGADHEQNRRPGTENILAIAGLGKACELAAEHLDNHAAHPKRLRDRLQQLLTEALPEVVVHGHPLERLPNTLNISFPGIEATTLLGALETVAASAGAACHADSKDASSVLAAMGVPQEVAMGAIRLSTGRFNTEEEIEEAGRQLIEAAKALSPKSTEAPANQPQEVVRLTHFSHGLGCACKLRPQDLETVVRDLKVLPHPDILVGPETADDAAVYRINDETALVETLDFFSPVVDDPYYFGAIAAANALSDVYAMGGTPLFALNIVAFPSKRLSLQVLRDILKGAQDKADEAGIPVLGGHTIEDNEPKYGMVVTGKVHPTKFWTNSGAQPGDALILTKPLGTGIYSTALKRGLLTQEQSDKLYQQMATLNAKAAGVFHDFTVHACTDVTGFGLTGHLRELAKGSAVDVELDYLSIPWMQSLFSLMVAGAIPGGTRNNLAYAEPWTEWKGSFSEHEKLALCDAQTSGGLLVAVPAGESEEILRALEDAGVVRAARIGQVLRSGEGKISVSK